MVSTDLFLVQLISFSCPHTQPFAGTRCVPRGFNTTCLPANIEDPMGRVVSTTVSHHLSLSHTPNPLPFFSVSLSDSDYLLLICRRFLLLSDPLTLFVQLTSICDYELVSMWCVLQCIFTRTHTHTLYMSHTRVCVRVYVCVCVYG